MRELKEICPFGISSDKESTPGNSAERVEFFQGNFQTALPYLKQSVAISLEVGDKMGAAWSLFVLAFVTFENRDVEAAQELIEESVRLCNELGDRRDLAYALAIHGVIAMSIGKLTIAATKYHESLSLFHEMGDKWGMLENVGGIAILTGMRGRPERALMLASAAATLNQAFGGTTPESMRKAGEQVIGQAQRSLDPQTVTEAFSRGSAMNLEEAVAMALEEVVDQE